MIDFMLPGSNILHNHNFDEYFDKDQTKYLILGTFPGLEFTIPNFNQIDNPEAWYYSSAGNTFWNLMFYALNNDNIENKHLKVTKQNLLSTNNFGITDIIQNAYRIRNSNQDSNLYVQKVRDLKDLLMKCKNITTIFLTSKSMLKEFFIPIYVDGLQYFTLDQKVNNEYEINNNKYKIENITYYFDKTKRILKVIPLNSPAREIPIFEIKKELYRLVFNNVINNN